MSIRLKLLKLLLAPDHRGALSEENYHAALSRAYQNPGVMQYLDIREDYLVRGCSEHVAEGKLKSADRFAGRLLEVRAMRTRMKACYNIRHKELTKRKAPKSAT